MKLIVKFKKIVKISIKLIFKRCKKIKFIHINLLLQIQAL